MASMAKGEKAVLEIQSEYGYGSAGAGGVIPGGATLVSVQAAPLLRVLAASLCVVLSLVPCRASAPRPLPAGLRPPSHSPSLVR
jgi:hypothetical protein